MNEKSGNLVRIVRLLSDRSIHAPGIVQWATCFYRTSQEQGKPVGPSLAVLADGFDLGVVLAERVLSGSVPFHIEGDTVVLSLNEEDWSIYSVRQATKQDIPSHLVNIEVVNPAVLAA